HGCRAIRRRFPRRAPRGPRRRSNRSIRDARGGADAGRETRRGHALRPLSHRVLSDPPATVRIGGTGFALSTKREHRAPLLSRRISSTPRPQLGTTPGRISATGGIALRATRLLRPVLDSLAERRG